MEPGESCEEAMIREVQEEAGITPLNWHFVFERVDSASGSVAWCFRVTEFSGEPRTVEDGITISWQRPEALLGEQCTFRDYNQQLFEHLGMI
jgi:8-oxo-dGTP pyrophosphatase MutT (NUDIX family)